MDHEIVAYKKRHTFAYRLYFIHADIPDPSGVRNLLTDRTEYIQISGQCGPAVL